MDLQLVEKPSITFMCLPVAASHILTSPPLSSALRLEEAIFAPSGENAIEVTGQECLSRVANSFPRCVSHKWICEVYLFAAAIFLPSGEKVTKPNHTFCA